MKLFIININVKTNLQELCARRAPVQDVHLRGRRLLRLWGHRGLEGGPCSSTSTTTTTCTSTSSMLPQEHPYCATHVLGTQAESSDPLAKVPLDIQLRARWGAVMVITIIIIIMIIMIMIMIIIIIMITPRLVFTGVLKYAYELLTLDTFMKLPGDLQVGKQILQTFVNKSYSIL